MGCIRILWASNIEDSFYQTCTFLTRCGDNGITLNPNKFQFAKDEIEFVGLLSVNQMSNHACAKYSKAIEDFPTLTDITGMRSWFGLVNQISYAFSMAEKMQPFRDFLKPGNKFYWDDQLQDIFK